MINSGRGKACRLGPEAQRSSRELITPWKWVRLPPGPFRPSPVPNASYSVPRGVRGCGLQPRFLRTVRRLPERPYLCLANHPFRNSVSTKRVEKQSSGLMAATTTSACSAHPKQRMPTIDLLPNGSLLDAGIPKRSSRLKPVNRFRSQSTRCCLLSGGTQKSTIGHSLANRVPKSAHSRKLFDLSPNCMVFLPQLSLGRERWQQCAKAWLMPNCVAIKSTSESTA